MALYLVFIRELGDVIKIYTKNRRNGQLVGGNV